MLLLGSITSINVRAENITENIKGDGVKVELSKEDKRVNDEKYNMLMEMNKSSLMRSSGAKTNYVGNYMQEKYYTCGPAAAKNLIAGYVWANDGSSPSFASTMSSLYIPEESQLESELGTTTSGTNFGAQWTNVLNKYARGNNYTIQPGLNLQRDWEVKLRNCVVGTINKTSNYNVIANLNHGPSGKDSCVNDFYANKYVAHYVTIYGYDDSRVFISDSNDKMGRNRKYSTGYYSMAYTTRNRGIVW